MKPDHQNQPEWLALAAKAKAARKKETVILVLFVISMLALAFGMSVAWEVIRALIWKQFQ